MRISHQLRIRFSSMRRVVDKRRRGSTRNGRGKGRPRPRPPPPPVKVLSLIVSSPEACIDCRMCRRGGGRPPRPRRRRMVVRRGSTERAIVHARGRVGGRTAGVMTPRPSATTRRRKKQPQKDPTAPRLPLFPPPLPIETRVLRKKRWWWWQQKMGIVVPIPLSGPHKKACQPHFPLRLSFLVHPLPFHPLRPSPPPRRIPLRRWRCRCRHRRRRQQRLARIFFFSCCLYFLVCCTPPPCFFEALQDGEGQPGGILVVVVVV